MIVRGKLKAVVRRSNHRFGLSIVDVAAVVDNNSVLDTNFSYYPSSYVCAMFSAESAEAPFKFGDYETGSIVSVLPNTDIGKYAKNLTVKQGVIIDRAKDTYQVLVDGEVQTVAWDKIMPTNRVDFSWQEDNITDVIKPLIVELEETKSDTEQ